MESCGRLYCLGRGTYTPFLLVKTLGYEAIAEGVEEVQQYEYLQSIGCDVIQGFYFAKPKTVEEIEKLLV